MMRVSVDCRNDAVAADTFFLLSFEADATACMHMLSAVSDWLMATPSPLDIASPCPRPFNCSFPARSTMVRVLSRLLPHRETLSSLRIMSTEKMQCDRDDFSFILVLRVLRFWRPLCSTSASCFAETSHRWRVNSGSVSHLSPPASVVVRLVFLLIRASLASGSPSRS